MYKPIPMKKISDSILICNSLDYVLKIHEYHVNVLKNMMFSEST